MVGFFLFLSLFLPRQEVPCTSTLYGRLVVRVAVLKQESIDKGSWSTLFLYSKYSRIGIRSLLGFIGVLVELRVVVNELLQLDRGYMRLKSRD